MASMGTPPPLSAAAAEVAADGSVGDTLELAAMDVLLMSVVGKDGEVGEDRKSTRLNSSHWE